jgi:hypothetical protein
VSSNSGPSIIGGRKLVFVSHANPEQNDFARWLSARLANAGYEVWSDVTKLIGGEVFWDNIEDAIRHHAAKVLVAVSMAANTKNGVLDEVSLAVTIERKDNIPQFVVPLRVDDIDFADFRANISRKNAIDFSKSWADGLAAVLKVLERDGVPKGPANPTDVAKLCTEKLDPALKPMAGTETLLTNWLPIESLPLEISIFDLDLSEPQVRDAMKPTTLPWFPYFRLVGAFGTEADLRADLSPELQIKREYLIGLEVFLKGKPPELPGLEAREARNHVTSLVRQAWNRTMRKRGLSSFEMASKSLVWFFTKGQIADDKVYFVDHAGKRRSKKVVGRSEKRNVYWHLGFQAKAKAGDEGYIVLKPAVIFSQDGKTPLTSARRMHRLRRGFCRSWWNPQWRDLMLAFIAWLADGKTTIELDTGMAGAIVLSASPFTLEIPVTFSDPPVKSKTLGGPPEPDEEADEPPDVPIEPEEEWDGDGNETDDDAPDDEESSS